VQRYAILLQAKQLAAGDLGVVQVIANFQSVVEIRS
jgi:hypothetical protein